MTDFYQTLTHLKADNPALWNGEWGGDLKIVETNNNEAVLCFSRKKEDNTVVAIFNLSNESVSSFMKNGPTGNFTDIMSGQEISLPVNGLLLQPWGFKIFVR